MATEPDQFTPSGLPRRATPARVEVLDEAGEPLDSRALSDAELEVIPAPPTGAKAKRVALILFLCTLVCTFVAGMLPGYPLPLANPLQFILASPAMRLEMLTSGVTYACCVMLILGFHEMGHWLQARRYGVAASLPYFIPFPLNPFGTMGAVIFQGARRVGDQIIVDTDRKQMFDIAITGPLAGLIVTLPITLYGVYHAELHPIPEHFEGIIYGDPLVLQWMIEWVHGPRPANVELNLNAWVFAGWVGLFITALNLIPIGQLDGGHMLYALIGRKAHYVAWAMMGLSLIGVLATGSYGFLLMLFLLLVMGVRHPPTLDDTVPLGWFRVTLGWLMLAFIFIGFTPTPIVMLDGPPAP